MKTRTIFTRFSYNNRNFHVINIEFSGDTFKLETDSDDFGFFSKSKVEERKNLSQLYSFLLLPGVFLIIFTSSFTPFHLASNWGEFLFSVLSFLSCIFLSDVTPVPAIPDRLYGSRIRNCTIYQQISIKLHCL